MELHILALSDSISHSGRDETSDRDLSYRVFFQQPLGVTEVGRCQTRRGWDRYIRQDQGLRMARIYRFISLPSPGVSKVKITQATHLFHLSVHPIHCIEPLPTHGFFIWQVERTRFLIFRIHELRHDQQCKSIFSKPRPIRRRSTIKTHSSLTI